MCWLRSSAEDWSRNEQPADEEAKARKKRAEFSSMTVQGGEVGAGENATMSKAGRPKWQGYMQEKWVVSTRPSTAGPCALLPHRLSGGCNCNTTSPAQNRARDRMMGASQNPSAMGARPEGNLRRRMVWKDARSCWTWWCPICQMAQIARYRVAWRQPLTACCVRMNAKYHF